MGCGTGEEAVNIVQQLTTGHVIAIDNSEMMISAAQERAKKENIPISFKVQDAHHLEFSEDLFHAARAEKVFQLLVNPTQALREMLRVVRPLGRVAKRT